MKQVLIEGYTVDELLSLPDDQIAAFVGEPLVFRAGSAEILGSFWIARDRFIVELAHIDGGGEGVLPTLWLLANRYAARNQLKQIEWIVHAVHCAKPNLKLRRILERRGFVVENREGVGEVYYLCQSMTG